MTAAPGAWFAGHVLLSIGAYAALTLAALAACGVLLLERAFKARKDSWATPDSAAACRRRRGCRTPC